MRKLDPVGFWQDRNRIERGSFWRWLDTFTPLVLALIAYGIAAVLLSHNLDHFDGDEPHYVLVADSLCRNGDADLRNDYEGDDYLAFYPHDNLDPHAYDYRNDGTLRSIHSLGLPFLLTIPHCILGHPYWARLEMAALAALASWSVFLTIRNWSKSSRLAYATWAAVTFTMPMWGLAAQVYPGVVATLGVAVALQLFLSRPLSTGKVLGIGLVVALLPWLHIRFAVLGLLIAATTVVSLVKAKTGWKAWICLLVPLAISSLLWMWNAYVWYGGVLPNAAYRPWLQQAGPLTWEGMYLSLANLTVGREFGLVTYAPIYLLALVGLVMMLLHRRSIIVAPLIWLLGYVLAVVLSQAVYQIDQGYSFPARMLLPVTPLLAIPLAYSVWHTRWLRVVGLLLFLLSVTISVQSLLQPYKALHNWNGVSELPLLRQVQRIYPALQYLGQEAKVDITRTDRWTGQLTSIQTTDSPALLADPLTDEPGPIVLTPNLAFHTGLYTATITLSSQDADPAAVVAQIDIVTDEGSRVLAAREVFAHEFSAGSEPQAFSLAFATRDNWPIRVRVYYSGLSRLWVHAIDITPQAELRSDPYPDWPIVLSWGLFLLIAGLLAAKYTRPIDMEPVPDG